jgi:hypothetical protein
MKVAILGTRGIPNNYGGFEQFTEYLSKGLVKLGCEVTVFNPHFHVFKGDELEGVKIRRAYCPEDKLGSAAHFVYDYLSLKDVLKLNYDIIYEAGYGTAAFSYFLKKKGYPYLLTNMDGLEWKRSKWNGFTKKLMRYAEKLAVKKSDYIIADNIGIQEYFQTEYGHYAHFLPYGADIVTDFDESNLSRYNLTPRQYYILIARLEPENNVDVILQAYLDSNEKLPFIVVGNYKTTYGNYLLEKYKNTTIRFIGGLYEKNVLDALRCFAKAYLHGHSVGGTNPSLLEAMASRAFIISHNNKFNGSVLEGNAVFFDNAAELTDIFNTIDKHIYADIDRFISDNDSLIKNKYTWDEIIRQHYVFFSQILSNRV